jgi:hypothetical protein
MPEKAATTHVLMSNELVLYQRERSNVWQCRYKVDGVWQRATTKQRDLGKAKARAKELMLEAEIRRRSNLPFITRKFRHVAKLAIERMSTETAAGTGVLFVSLNLAALARWSCGRTLRLRTPSLPRASLKRSTGGAT